MNQLTNLSSAEISAQHEQDAKDLTRILPASKKVYIEGSRPDIQLALVVSTTHLLWYMTLQVFILTRMFKLI